MLAKVRDALRPMARDSVPMAIIYHMIDNHVVKNSVKAGKEPAFNPSDTPEREVQDRVNDSLKAFDDYIEYSGIPRSSLKGKRILEIGPGGNMGVAVKFLLSGAKQVTCLERFHRKEDVNRTRQILNALKQSLGKDEQRILDKVVTLDSQEEMGIKSEKFRYVYGTALEDADQVLDTGSFDIIVSRSALEHTYEPGVAMTAMDNLLAPGGSMIHKIDFHDHGMFTQGDMHPLTFLTIPDFLYFFMGRESGKPNRQLIDFYVDTVKSLRYEGKVFITSIVGAKDELRPYKETIKPSVDFNTSVFSLVRKLKPKMSSPYREMPDDTLIIGGIFLVAKKRSAGEIFKSALITTSV